jgi:hypothetical protein
MVRRWLKVGDCRQTSAASGNRVGDQLVIQFVFLVCYAHIVTIEYSKRPADNQISLSLLKTFEKIFADSSVILFGEPVLEGRWIRKT